MQKERSIHFGGHFMASPRASDVASARGEKPVLFSMAGRRKAGTGAVFRLRTKTIMLLKSFCWLTSVLFC